MDRRKHSEEATEQELLDALSEPTIGLTLLEKLVLAIIDAHPASEGGSRDARLRDAMYALRGEYWRRGSKVEDDRLVLYWMAVQFDKKQARPPVSGDAEGDESADRPTEEQARVNPLNLGPSLFGELEQPVDFNNSQDLARAAIKRFGLSSMMTSDRAITQRLAQKFEAGRGELLQSVRLASAQPHLIEHQILGRICTNLGLVGVKTSVPDKPQAF